MSVSVPFVGAGAFFRDLRRHGDRFAVTDGQQVLTYDGLADRVDAVTARLGPVRRLVLVAVTNSIDSLVDYLGALAAGSVVLLVDGAEPERFREVQDRYDPDVLLLADGLGRRCVERRGESTHRLSPDLALLLTTSGSTGSPKLVRLSYENVQSNAEAIAAVLDIRPDDRAVTSLPMHYCYGLSVVHSHLTRGAGLVVTDASVVDDAFWRLVRDNGTTTFAGVPYTFELLDHLGPDVLAVPTLRTVTQAGGRLDPQRVVAYAEQGLRQGWDFHVMYGQTEATARMAHLPPELARAYPSAIGRPIPGGSFRIDSADAETDDGAGELVYRGPNVMLGYATTPDDLALGRTVTELRTGDLARHTAAGLYEIVGRRSRFAKVAGLRIDLQRVEGRLRTELALSSCCVEVPQGLGVLFVGASERADPVGRQVAALAGVPPHLVVPVARGELPRTSNGKPDLATATELVRAAAEARTTGAHLDCVGGVEEQLVRLYAQVLGRDDVGPGDSFLGLDGDSLSYLELALQVEDSLGRLPRGWHAMSIRELGSGSREVERPGGRRRVGTWVGIAAGFVLLTALRGRALRSPRG